MASRIQAEPEFVPLKEGATYNSYAEFEVALKRYQNEENILFTTKYSETVAHMNKKKNCHYPERLKYVALELVCKHYGHARSRSRGIRPRQKTFKKGCEAFMRVNASSKKGNLLVSKMHTVHNHEISARIFQLYPESRRVANGHHRKDVEQLIECDIRPSILQKTIKKLTGKSVTAKDIANMKKSLRKKSNPKNLDPTEQLFNELEQLKINDPGSEVYIGLTNDDADMDIVFIQTADMRNTLKIFPDILIIDTTYTVNKVGMPLISFLVIDGFGNGRIVAYCFVSKERPEIVKSAVELFKLCNEAACNDIKTVVIDKDYTEIASLEDVLPCASIQLCLLHVLKVFRDRISKEYHVDEVRIILEQMTFGIPPEEYLQLLVELEKVASQEFMQYFMESWHKCTEAWMYYDKGMSPNSGNSITSKLESRHEKIKRVLDRSSTLVDAVRMLLLIHRNKTFSVQYEVYEAQAKTPYIANCNDPNIAMIVRTLTPYAADLIIRQYEFSSCLRNVEFNENILTVPATDKSYTMTLTSCTCNVYKQLLIPCSHLFHYRRSLGVDAYEPTLCPQRWTVDYNISASSNEEPGKPALNTRDGRLKDARALTDDMCSLMALKGGKPYESKKRQLEMLFASWKNKDSFEVIQDIIGEKPHSSDLSRLESSNLGVQCTDSVEGKDNANDPNTDPSVRQKQTSDEALSSDLSRLGSLNLAAQCTNSVEGKDNANDPNTDLSVRPKGTGEKPLSSDLSRLGSSNLGAQCTNSVEGKDNANDPNTDPSVRPKRTRKPSALFDRSNPNWAPTLSLGPKKRKQSSSASIVHRNQQDETVNAQATSVIPRTYKRKCKPKVVALSCVVSRAGDFNSTTTDSNLQNPADSEAIEETVKVEIDDHSIDENSELDLMPTFDRHYVFLPEDPTMDVDLHSATTSRGNETTTNPIVVKREPEDSEDCIYDSAEPNLTTSTTDQPNFLHIEINSEGHASFSYNDIDTQNEPSQCTDLLEETDKETSSSNLDNLNSSSDNKFQCGKCDFGSNKLNTFLIHMRTHPRERPYSCDICTYRSMTSSALDRHKLRHSGEKRFRCRRCDFSSIEKCDLKVHWLRHPEMTQYKCDLCEFRSPYKSSVVQHQLRHAEKRFRCNMCDYRSHEKRLLLYHQLHHRAHYQKQWLPRTNAPI